MGTLGSDKNVYSDDKTRLTTLNSDYRPKEIEVCYDQYGGAPKQIVLRVGIWDAKTVMWKSYETRDLAVHGYKPQWYDTRMKSNCETIYFDVPNNKTLTGVEVSIGTTT